MHSESRTFYQEPPGFPHPVLGSRQHICRHSVSSCPHTAESQRSALFPTTLGCAFPPSAFLHHLNQHQLSKTVLHRSVGNENLLCLGQSCEIHPSEVFFSPSPQVSCINAYILSAQINAYIFSAQVRSVSCSTESVGVRLCVAHLGNALQCCGEPGVLGSGLQRCSPF